MYNALLHIITIIISKYLLLYYVSHSYIDYGSPSLALSTDGGDSVLPVARHKSPVYNPRYAWSILGEIVTYYYYDYALRDDKRYIYRTLFNIIIIYYYLLIYTDSTYL